MCIVKFTHLRHKMTLTEIEDSLITAAIKAVNAVPLDRHGNPNDDHNVGAAVSIFLATLPQTPEPLLISLLTTQVLTSTGRIFTGINLSHYTGGPCAETVAFANAAGGGIDSSTLASLRDPKREQLVLCVAVNEKGDVINPCGRCRQQMWDYYPEVRVIVNDKGRLEVLGLDVLLPFACSVYGEE